MYKDLVSIIITTYKRPFEFVLRAVKSVLMQTYSNWELFIVDDSPNDYSERVVIKQQINALGDKRIKYILHGTNLGACAARNTGIRMAKGEFIAFLDDDDEWLPQKIEKQITKINQPEIGLVYCSSYTIINVNGKTKKTLREYRIEGFVFDKLILKNFIGSTSFVMVKRQALFDCGLFNIEMQSAQDYELWLRIAKKYAVACVSEPLVNYYIHNGERITTNIEKKIQGLEKIIEINRDFLKDHRKAYAVRLLLLVPLYIKKNGKKYALKKWLKAIKVFPFSIEAIKTLKSFLKR